VQLNETLIKSQPLWTTIVNSWAHLKVRLGNNHCSCGLAQPYHPPINAIYLYVFVFCRNKIVRREDSYGVYDLNKSTSFFFVCSHSPSVDGRLRSTRLDAVGTAVYDLSTVHRLIDDHGTIFGLNLHSKFAAFPDEDLNTSLLAEEVRGQVDGCGFPVSAVVSLSVSPNTRLLPCRIWPSFFFPSTRPRQIAGPSWSNLFVTAHGIHKGFSSPSNVFWFCALFFSLELARWPALIARAASFLFNSLKIFTLTEEMYFVIYLPLICSC
jgi:hypothetical protein